MRPILVEIWEPYLTLEYRSQIEPGWHAWISYMVDKPPTQDPILQTGVRAVGTTRASTELHS